MIIAEIGQNFCGDMQIAKELIIEASVCGADLAKFQLYDTDKIYAPDSPFKSQAKEAELTYDQAYKLFYYGKGCGIEVFFSVFDVERVKWCENIGVKRYKVAHSKRCDTDILKAISATGKEVFISYSSPLPAGELNGRRIPLYCVPSYPTTHNQLDFSAIAKDGWAKGFSDHTIGLDAAKVAIVVGAAVIEKHFCARHNFGVDAPWSMTPEELRELKGWETMQKRLLG
jgi:sialic acid synthase SpsE